MTSVQVHDMVTNALARRGLQLDWRKNGLYLDGVKLTREYD